MGVIALLAGGALTGAVLFGGALVSAQTPSDTPTAEEGATPHATQRAQTPDNDATPDDSGRPHDGMCDKDGDGQPDGRGSSGSSGFSPGGSSSIY
jgi:hypothetical protein